MKSTISKEVLRSSHKTKRARRQQILMDKIVNPQTEPKLYNVQSATMAVMAKTSPFSNKKQLRKLKTTNNRDLLSMETLMIMNIVSVPYGRNYSLLRSNSTKPAIINPNILDSLDFANTSNRSVLAKDKFPTGSDPFYQLDEAVYSPLAYKTPKLSNNKVANAPDLSFVLSNLNYINQNTDYFGKSKYF